MDVTFAGVVANPCPFCNGKNLAWETVEHNRAQMWSVVCRNTDCFAQGPIDLGKSGAIDKWNIKEETILEKMQGMNDIPFDYQDKYIPHIVKSSFDIPFDPQNDEDRR